MGNRRLIRRAAWVAAYCRQPTMRLKPPASPKVEGGIGFEEYGMRSNPGHCGAVCGVCELRGGEKRLFAVSSG